MPAPNPLNRPLAEGIRQLGFRKWYERELLSSHAHMALAVLAAVAMIACFEAYKGASVGDKLMNTVFLLVSAAVTLWSLRRYLFLLMHAEEIANQANCPRCDAYGLLTVAETVRTGADGTRLVPVCCKKCGFTWVLND